MKILDTLIENLLADYADFIKSQGDSTENKRAWATALLNESIRVGSEVHPDMPGVLEEMARYERASLLKPTL
jgi:hypothetical protein